MGARELSFLSNEFGLQVCILAMESPSLHQGGNFGIRVLFLAPSEPSGSDFCCLLFSAWNASYFEFLLRGVPRGLFPMGSAP
jgi:hypothetical protein